MGVSAPEGIVQGHIQLVHQLLLRCRPLVVIGQKWYRHDVFLTLFLFLFLSLVYSSGQLRAVVTRVQATYSLPLPPSPGLIHCWESPRLNCPFLKLLIDCSNALYEARRIFVTSPERGRFLEHERAIATFNVLTVVRLAAAPVGSCHS